MEEDCIEYISPEAAKSVLKQEKGTVTLLVNLLRERVEVELDYSRRLHAWIQRHEGLLEKAENQAAATRNYGVQGLAEAVRLLLEEGVSTAGRHEDIGAAIGDQDGPVAILRAFLSADPCACSTPRSESGRAERGGSVEREDLGPLLASFPASLEAHERRVQDTHKAYKKYQSAKEKLEKRRGSAPAAPRAGDHRRSRSERGGMADPQVLSLETRVDLWRDKLESFMKREQAEREAFVLECRQFEAAVMRRQRQGLEVCVSQLQEYITCLQRSYSHRETAERVRACLAGASTSLDNIGISLLVSRWQTDNLTSLRLPPSQVQTEDPSTSPREVTAVKDMTSSGASGTQDEAIDIQDHIATLVTTSKHSPNVKLKKPMRKSTFAAEDRPSQHKPSPKAGRKFFQSKPTEEKDSEVCTETPVEVIHIGEARGMSDSGGLNFERPPPARPLCNAFESTSVSRDADAGLDLAAGSSSSHSLSVESLTSEDNNEEVGHADPPEVKGHYEPQQVKGHRGGTKIKGQVIRGHSESQEVTGQSEASEVGTEDMGARAEAKTEVKRVIHRSSLFRSPDTTDDLDTFEVKPNVKVGKRRYRAAGSMKTLTSIDQMVIPIETAPKRPFKNTLPGDLVGSMNPDPSSSSSEEDEGGDLEEVTMEGQAVGRDSRLGGANVAGVSGEGTAWTEVQYRRLQEDTSNENLEEGRDVPKGTTPRPFLPMKKGAFKFSGLKTKKFIGWKPKH